MWYHPMTSPDPCWFGFVFCDGRLWILGESDWLVGYSDVGRRPVILWRTLVSAQRAWSCFLVYLSEGDRWAYKEQKQRSDKTFYTMTDLCKKGRTSVVSCWWKDCLISWLVYLTDRSWSEQEEQKERQRDEGEERRIKQRWKEKRCGGLSCVEGRR